MFEKKRPFLSACDPVVGVYGLVVVLVVGLECDSKPCLTNTL